MSASSEFGKPVSRLAPLDLVLKIDRTGSMAQDQSSPTDLDQAKAAAVALLDSLSPTYHYVALGVLGASDPTDLCSSGGGAGKLKVPLADNETLPMTWLASPYPNTVGPVNDYADPNSQMRRTLACIDSGGRTNLEAPIASAHTYLKTRGRPGVKQGIIIMTDGAANMPPDQQPCEFAFDIANAAKADGIEIVTIGFGVAGAKCTEDTTGSPYHFTNSHPVWVTKLLADMASPVDDVPADDNGCTSGVENTDGDNFFCLPKSSDLSTIFVLAATQLTGRQAPRLIG